jgi:hypothetical protein
MRRIITAWECVVSAACLKSFSIKTICGRLAFVKNWSDEGEQGQHMKFGGLRQRDSAQASASSVPHDCLS